MIAAGSSPRNEFPTVIWGAHIVPVVFSHLHQLMFAFTVISGLRKVIIIFNSSDKKIMATGMSKVIEILVFKL